MGAGHVEARLAASVGDLEAPVMPDFQAVADVPNLCDELNATETVFPRTNLRLIFKLGTK